MGYSKPEDDRAMDRLAADVQKAEPFCEMTGPMAEPDDPTTGLPLAQPKPSRNDVGKMADFLALGLGPDAIPALRRMATLAEHRTCELMLADQGTPAARLVTGARDLEARLFGYAAELAITTIECRELKALMAKMADAKRPGGEG